MNNFKAAALSITTLYRSGLQSSKRAYTAGYEACLQDVLELVQAGVSDGINARGTGGVDGEAMSVGRVMDWVEARLEDIKEDKREEDRRAVEGGESQQQPTVASTSALQPRKSSPPSNKPLAKSMSPTIHHVQIHSSSPSPSPAPPSSRASRHSSRRDNRDRENRDYASAATTPTTEPFSFVFEPPEHLVTPSPTLGAKRRHATMMYEHSHAHPLNSALFSPDSIPPATAVIPPPRNSTTNSSGSNRRKGKTTRQALSGNAGNGNVTANPGSGHGEDDRMQVEFEEGRERKRVARR